MSLDHVRCFFFFLHDSIVMLAEIGACKSPFISVFLTLVASAVVALHVLLSSKIQRDIHNKTRL